MWNSKTKSQSKKITTLFLISLIFGISLILATWYSTGTVSNSFEPTSPLNASTVPNHWATLNVSVNTTGNLDIKIFANSNYSRLNLQDSLVFHTLNATEDISYNFTSIPIQHDDEGLVALYHFDNLSAYGENATWVYDFAGSGGKNNGTVVGGSVWNESRKMGGAYEFDGDDDYVKILHNDSIDFNLTNSYAISVWVKMDSVDSESEVISKIATSYPYQIKIRTDGANEGKLQFSIYNGSSQQSITTGETFFSDLKWHHIMAMSNGTTLILFIDGENKQINQYINDITDGDINNTGNIYVGSRLGTGQFLNGSIDDLAIYNKSFNSTEVKNIYQLEKTIKKQYWKVNATDTFANSNETGVYEFTTLSPTITINFSSSTGDIRSDFYGTNTHADGRWLGFGTTIDTDASGGTDALSNYTWHREKLLDSGIKTIRIDMYLDKTGLYSNTTDVSGINFTGNLANVTEEFRWAYENNINIIPIISYMPSWLSDNSSGKCSNLIYCPPRNATKYGNIVVDWINRSTNGGEYISVIKGLEFWNEPYSSFFMGRLAYDNINKATNYTKMFNDTLPIIEASYPNIPVGATGRDTDLSPNLYNTIFSNLTTKIGFIAMHPYQDNYIDNPMSYYINNLKSNCSSFGANCSWIIISEYNVENNTLKNTTSLENEYGLNLAFTYIDSINAINVSVIPYQWSERFSYGAGLNFPEYPDKWHFVSEPDIDDELTIAYNVTKSFATYHRTGSTVYTSSSDNSDVKVVSSRYGDDYYVTIINTDSEQVNVTLDFTGAPINQYVMDKDTGTLYLTNSSRELGIMDGYGIKYLGTPTLNITEGINLIKIAKTGETYTSIEINFTDTSTNRKSIASGLAISIIGNIRVNADCSSLTKITYTPNGGTSTVYERGNARNLCSNNQILLESVIINPSSSSNKVELEFGCSVFTRTGYMLVMLLSSLALLVIVLVFVYKKYRDGDVTIADFIILFIIIIVCLILWTASGQNLGGSCGPVAT